MLSPEPLQQLYLTVTFDGCWCAQIFSRSMEALTSYQAAHAISLGYLFIVVYLGPRLMAGRDPCQLKLPIRVYHLTQVGMNLHMLYLCYQLMGNRILDFWSNVCNPISVVNDDPDLHNKISFILHYFYFNKIIDLLDTVFFTLTKQKSKVTFHHVFHHSTVVVAAWINGFVLKQELTIHLFATNIFVHALTHMYYLLSDVCSSRLSLRLRKLIATIQLIELLLMLSMVGKLKWENCKRHPLFLPLWVGVVCPMFVLFFNVYVRGHLRGGDAAVGGRSLGGTNDSWYRLQLLSIMKNN